MFKPVPDGALIFSRRKDFFRRQAHLIISEQWKSRRLALASAQVLTIADRSLST